MRQGLADAFPKEFEQEQLSPRWRRVTDGLRYTRDLINEETELSLIHHTEKLEFSPFRTAVRLPSTGPLTPRLAAQHPGSFGETLLDNIPQFARLWPQAIRVAQPLFRPFNFGNTNDVVVGVSCTREISDII